MKNEKQILAEMKKLLNMLKEQEDKSEFSNNVDQSNANERKSKIRGRKSILQNKIFKALDDTFPDLFFEPGNGYIEFNDPVGKLTGHKHTISIWVVFAKDQRSINVITSGNNSDKSQKFHSHDELISYIDLKLKQWGKTSLDSDRIPISYWHNPSERRKASIRARSQMPIVATNRKDKVSIDKSEFSNEQRALLHQLEQENEQLKQRIKELEAKLSPNKKPKNWQDLEIDE